jgi:hypothetical protein
LKLARLKYGGQWNPEPYAWQRFARILKRDVSWDLEIAAVDWFALKPEVAPIAHLTGLSAYTPTDVEIAALKSYVESGGVVLIDSCGSSPAFAQSMRVALAVAFPDQKLQPIADTDAMLKASFAGMRSIDRLHLRPYAAQKLTAAPPLEQLTAGKGKVIFSSLDITTGLLGTNPWGLIGYNADSAQTVVNNLVIWAGNTAANSVGR